MQYSFWRGAYTQRIPGGYEVWYPESEPRHYVKLCGPPNTLAGRIVRLQEDLPRYHCHLEIIGDDVNEVEGRPSREEEDDFDFEDCSDEMATLPIITYDSDTHFVKAPTYKQEIRHLRQCQGSSHIVHLLGRTENGDLVFPKYLHDLSHAATWNPDHCRIENIKKWMLEIVDGISFLHSLGIIHRDLVIRNVLASDPVIICDLQCLNATGHCCAPELDDGNRSCFSTASDVFALGTLLWECCYFNYPHSREVALDYPPPHPFRNIFLACTRDSAKDRPTVAQLRAMLEKT